MRVTSLVFVSFSLYSDHSFCLILGMELNHQRLIQKLTRVYDIADKQGVQDRFSSYVHVCHFCYSSCPGNPLFPTYHTCIFLPSFFTSLCSSSYHMRVLIGSYTWVDANITLQDLKVKSCLFPQMYWYTFYQYENKHKVKLVHFVWKPPFWITPFLGYIWEIKK